MEPAFVNALLVVLFAATHMGLASHPIRSFLVRRFGEIGFVVVFSAVAALSFSLLVHYTALHLGDAAPGLALGRVAVLRWLLIGLIATGFALMIGSLSVYSGSPMALFATAVGPPRGIERISRHAFFVGVMLWSGSHALLSSRLVAAEFFAGLALLALLGSRHQDRKLLRRYGESYADYLAQSSTLPFAAILAGRQQLVLSELPWLAMAFGLVFAYALREVHGQIFSAGGAWIIGFTFVGAALATLQSLYGRSTKTTTGSRDEESEQWTT